MVKDSYAANKQIIFSGDNYDEAWHAEAEQRGLKNLKTTPDALPEVLAEATLKVFGDYSVLSERELESRYEVWLEQYIINANIEAETAHNIAKTMILPAALRHLDLCGRSGLPAAGQDASALAAKLIGAIGELEQANAYPDGVEGMELALHARDKQLAAMVERARGRGQAREGRRQRALATAEVQRDPLRPVGPAPNVQFRALRGVKLDVHLTSFSFSSPSTSRTPAWRRCSPWHRRPRP